MDRFSLKGKWVVVTGAAGYFGRYFNQALLEAGANLVLMDRKRELLEEIGDDLRQKCPIEQRVICQPVDLYDIDMAERVFRSVDSLNQMDVLVNNAFDFSERTGMNTQSGRMRSATYEQLYSAFTSGIYWHFLAAQIFGYAMKERGRGSIINICSMYALVVPNPSLYEGTEIFNAPGYSMAKAGLLHQTRYWATEFGPEVRVNAISPGAFPNVETQTHNPPDPVVLDRLMKKILLKRMGHPTDLTGALIFLASDASSYMTGANLVIDGGFTIT